MTKTYKYDIVLGRFLTNYCLTQNPYIMEDKSSVPGNATDSVQAKSVFKELTKYSHVLVKVPKPKDKAGKGDPYMKKISAHSYFAGDTQIDIPEHFRRGDYPGKDKMFGRCLLVRNFYVTADMLGSEIMAEVFVLEKKDEFGTSLSVNIIAYEDQTDIKPRFCVKFGTPKDNGEGIKIPGTEDFVCFYKLNK